MTTMTQEEVSCPKCGGRMWDNRLSKKNPKAPDYKCRSRNCDGVVWPERGQQNGHSAPQSRQNAPQGYDVPPSGSMPYDDPTPVVAPVANQVQSIETGDRFVQLVVIHRACFKHALKLATEAQNVGIPVSLEGVSALAAQMLIAYREGR